ncbi:MAG TPA: class I SAM-dependent methyltransferase [Tissierellaceae bacterium]|nr:class I SAM-dependent methyltransferase [Tissierellaceae bacterium]
MGYKEIVNTKKITREIIFKHVDEGSSVLDCTVGNGNDTVYLADLVGDSGKVYGFDIQNQALENTLKKLINQNIENRVKLIKDSHENIDLYIEEKLDLIIYNLGYLPGGDKNIKTNKESTLISINKALNLLNRNGIILITCYTGHVGGLEEKNGVENLLKALDQRKYNVLKYDFINQINSPPILYGVEKNKNGR